MRAIAVPWWRRERRERASSIRLAVQRRHTARRGASGRARAERNRGYGNPPSLSLRNLSATALRRVAVACTALFFAVQPARVPFDRLVSEGWL